MAVKVYTSSQIGAPVMNGVVGSLIGVLDACLVNGYAAAAVESITVSDNTATVKTTAAHGFAEGDYALIAGAAEDDFNGEFKVRLVDSLRFSYPLYNASASAATGSITVKRPSAGWEKPFALPNQGVYRAKEGNRHYLHVNDSASTAGGVREAAMRGYRAMSAIDNSQEPFPTVAQKGPGVMVYKTTGADTSPRPWYVIADERFFYLGIQIADNTVGSIFTGGSWPYWHCFGELAFPFLDDDPYNTVIAGMANSNSIGDAYQNNGVFIPSNRDSSGNNGNAGYLLRGFGMLEGVPVQYRNMGHCWDETAIGEAQCFPYPHKADNGMMICPIRCTSENGLRGYLPGFYESMHGNVTGSIGMGAIIDGEFLGLEGRKLIALTGRQYTVVGMALFDITGPWR